MTDIESACHNQQVVSVEICVLWQIESWCLLKKSYHQSTETQNCWQFGACLDK